MKISWKKKAGFGLALAASAGLVLTGCSTSGGDSGGGSTGGSTDASGSCSTSGTDWNAVHALTDVYYTSTDGNKLPITDALTKPATDPVSIVYLDNDTPVSALLYAGLQSVTDVLPNATVSRIDVGSDAQSINTGFNSLLEQKPDIAVSVALDPTFFQNQIPQLEQAGVTLVLGSVTNADQFGLADTYSGNGSQTQFGKVLAGSTLLLDCGASKNYVFYSVPELAFSTVQANAWADEMKTLCPDCTARIQNVPIAQMASGADLIVSDLQAHPEVGAFATSVDNLQEGLDQKIQLAGIKDIPGIGQSSTPLNIQQIADGTQAQGQAIYLKQLMWMLTDEALRVRQGMDNPAATMDWSVYDQSIGRNLTKDTAPQYNNEESFVSMPDMEQQFAKLWGVAK